MKLMLNEMKLLRDLRKGSAYFAHGRDVNYWAGGGTVEGCFTEIAITASQSICSSGILSLPRYEVKSNSLSVDLGLCHCLVTNTVWWK